MPSNTVWVLTVGADGTLWVGTLGGGLARLDKDGRWQTYSKASTRGGLPNDNVVALAVGADGALWAGTDGGLARLDKDGRWQTYTKASTQGGLPGGFVQALAVGADGALWVGTDGGLARLDKNGGWQTYITGARVLRVMLGADGALWVGTDRGLARLDKDGHWQTYTKASTQGGLPNDAIETLTLGADGTLWIGTGEGLARLDRDGRWQAYSKANTRGGLQDNRVVALAVGAGGALWVGSVAGGLARLSKDILWQTYSKADTQGGLPNDNVWSLTVGTDGVLWAGTSNGLARLDKNGRWRTYTKVSTQGGLPDNGIAALAVGAQGALWVGTNGGLARFDKDGRWQTYSKASTQGGLPDDHVWSLAVSADGTLWVGTFGFGLARLDKDGQWQTYTKASTHGDLPEGGIHALAVGADGVLWVGTESGLGRFDKDARWQIYNQASTQGGLPNERVRALALSADGALWVGTARGGLARLDKNGRWQTYTEANTRGGLPDHSVAALAIGADSSLWVGTAGGLGNFSRRVVPSPRIVNVIGGKIDVLNEVTEPEQNVAVAAFDDSYLTQPGMFHYVWRLSEIDRTTLGPEIRTKSSIYTATFPHDGIYQLSVLAVDRYGNRSDPKYIKFKVALPKPKSVWDKLIAAWPIVAAAVTGLFALSFIVLLLLAHRSQRAFNLLSDAAWARWLTWPFFFLRHVPVVQRWVLEPWFQAVRRGTMVDIPYFDPPVSTAAGSLSEGVALLRRLRDTPRLWLRGRSGMGKSSVFAAWERTYFVAADMPDLKAAARQYGFILVALPLRHYAALPVPDTNRPESWVLEIVRRRLEQHGFTTRDLGLVDALLKAGHIAVALDGTNEVDRDLALNAFASQFPQARLLVTSQSIAPSLAGGERWEEWELPQDIAGVRDGLLALWLGAAKGAILARRVAAEDLAATVVSGYDLRLLADLAAVDPEHATLPADRVALYRAMLARAIGLDGQPLALEGLKQLAWTMVMQRRRRILPDDEKALGVGTLSALEREGLRILRSIGAEREFRHDQMRAFLAALWLVEETPTLPVLQKVAADAGAFGVNRRDQEELWGFVAPLLTANSDLETLWRFASDDPIERGFLLDALQAEADKRGITLVRSAQRREPAAMDI